MGRQSGRMWAAALTCVALVAGVLATGGVASAEPGGIVISEIHYHPLTDVDTDEIPRVDEHERLRHRRVGLVLHRRHHVDVR